MKKFLVATACIALYLSASIPTALGQGIFDAMPGGDVPTGVRNEECRKAIVLELAKAQRKFRGVVFGYPRAFQAPMGTVRFSIDGTSWIKLGTAEWRSVAPGFEEIQRTNTEMDEQDEFISTGQLTGWRNGRRGLFRTRRVLTSELVPFLVQSARAFQCEADTVCDQALASLTKTVINDDKIQLNPVGCLPVEVAALPACQLATTSSNALAEADIRSFCPSVVDTMLEREGDVLKLAVEYDAAYRSMLQFSGNFDLFLEEFRWPLTFTIRQAAGVIGQLGRIPCFLSSCEDILPVFNSSSSSGT